MNRRLGTNLLGMAVVACMTLGCASVPEERDVARAPATVHTPSPAPSGAATNGMMADTTTPDVPEPTTIEGYAQMFDTVDDAEWGGGDVSYSVDLPDGRRVWLYGDTVSATHGFVRNTAIVQHGGTLHVSHGGAQVIPSEPTTAGRTTVYWPETATVTRQGLLRIVTAPISTGTDGAWDFHRTGPTGKSRVALVSVDVAGNLTFQRWAGWQARPDIDYDETGPSDIRILGPNHWGYAETTHHNIRLQDGSHLITLSQNWDDPFDAHRKPDGSLRYRDWRPLFYSTANPPPH